MDLQEVGINAGNWVDSVQDGNYWRDLVNAALNLRVPEAMELVRPALQIYHYNFSRCCVGTDPINWTKTHPHRGLNEA